MSTPVPVRIALGIAATGAVATTVTSALHSDWTTAVWSLTSALALTNLATHTCPRPAPATVPDAQRGVELVVFNGGPLDGAEILAPVSHVERFLAINEGFDVQGTTYRIDSVHHTAYNATAEAPTP